VSPCWGQSDVPAKNEAQAPIWGAFLCDNDGRITRDFGESLSARSLVELIEPPNLLNFLEAVSDRDAVPGWEMKIHYEGSAANLVLQGLLTQGGILVFATLAPCAPPMQRDQSVAPGSLSESTPKKVGVKRAPTLTEQQEEWLSAAVHDFKNPISCIISSCEFLEGYSRESLEPEQLEVVRAIQSAARTLLRLSANIARIQSPS
jgi:hypothetical protein